MIQINLLPRKVRKKAVILRKQLGIMGAVVLGSFILSYWLNASISGEIESEQAQLNAKRSEINRLKAELPELDKFEKEKAENLERLNVVDRLKAARSGPVRVLDTLASKIPSGKLWVENLKEDGANLKLTGWAADNQVVAEFMTSLSASPYFKEVELESVNQEDFQVGEGPTARKFRLNKFAIITKPSYR